MSIFKKTDKKAKRKTTLRIMLISGAVLAVGIAVILINQSTEKARIDAQILQLEEEYKLLFDEKQRLENMVEYVHSEEYLLQYAREKLGFVKQGDIKFDTGEE